jgi:hypothetical protein
MKRNRIGVIAATALATLAFSASAGAGSQDSKIILSADAPTFHGLVDSSSKHCIEGRRVKLLRITDGRDKVLGRARTDADGFWGILHAPKTGTYYAKVKRQTISNGIFCGGDRSNRVKIG